MTVLDFSYFSADDPYDMQFECYICWSRVYEYKYAIDYLDGSVHNTSWGYEGVHVTFRDWLDDNVEDVVHSDIKPGREIWDITTPPRPDWIERFDTLLCISTLEHVDQDPVRIIEENFMPQLRPDGIVVITFDVPGFQIQHVESWLDQPIGQVGNPLGPLNSVCPDLWGRSAGPNYRVGGLVLEKEGVT